MGICCTSSIPNEFEYKNESLDCLSIKYYIMNSTIIHSTKNFFR